MSKKLIAADVRQGIPMNVILADTSSSGNTSKHSVDALLESIETVITNDCIGSLDIAMERLEWTGELADIILETSKSKDPSLAAHRISKLASIISHLTEGSAEQLSDDQSVLRNQTLPHLLVAAGGKR